MQKVTSLREGVERIIKIDEPWEIIPMGETDMTEHLKVGDKIYPLFTWRSEPQPNGIKNNVPICKACSLKTSGAISRKIGIDRFMYQELDMAEYILGSDIKHLTAFINDNAANIILRMENERVALLELGASLPENAEEQTRHTVWGTEGMASTRIVSQKIRPQAVYFYSDDKEPQTFNDEIYALYGLGQDEQTKACEICKILANREVGEKYIEKDKKLKEYVKKAYDSNEKGERILVGGNK